MTSEPGGVNRPGLPARGFRAVAQPASPARHNAVALDLVLNGFAELVDGVDPGQWAAPTPCVEWDVRGLVNHVVMGQLLFAAVLRGQPPIDRFADHLGDDPAEAFRNSAEELLSAFDLPASMSGTFEIPAGVLPGGALLHLRLVEGLVHGWDLAVATGQQTHFPEEIAGTALVGTRNVIGQVPRQGRFGDEQSVSSVAPALEQLAALLGRQV